MSIKRRVRNDRALASLAAARLPRTALRPKAQAPATRLRPPVLPDRLLEETVRELGLERSERLPGYVGTAFKGQGAASPFCPCSRRIIESFRFPPDLQRARALPILALRQKPKSQQYRFHGIVRAPNDASTPPPPDPRPATLLILGCKMPAQLDTGL